MVVDPDTRTWLLTGSDPSVRARALVELFDRPDDDPELREARGSIGKEGWAARILADRQAEGHWETNRDSLDDLYIPKYIATNWRLIALAELGATRHDARVAESADLLVRSWSGKFGSFGDPQGELCIVGNCARTLLRLGYRDHPKVASSLAWLVSAQKADGGWHCFESDSGTLDAWEGLAAFAELTSQERTPAIERAIVRGAEFYLERSLLRETDGSSYPPWRRLHYPNHYYYDVLVGLRILAKLGYGRDPRLREPLDLLESKRRPDGRWVLEAVHPDLAPEDEYHPRGPVYAVAYESVGLPSRWITTEALVVLRAAGRL